MKTLKFKTKAEASVFMNDFFAQEYYGWLKLLKLEDISNYFNKGYKEEKELISQLEKCLKRDGVIWIKNGEQKEITFGRHDINITDNFEQGMEILKKINNAIDVTLSLADRDLLISWFDEDEVACASGVKFIHSWSFTLWCAIYELVTSNKIEVGE